MNVMVDFLMCFIAAAMFFLAVGRNTIVTAARQLSTAAAVLAAAGVVCLAAVPLAEALPNPLTDMAVKDMAELAGVHVPGWQSSYVSLIDWTALQSKAGYAELLYTYGVTEEVVAQAAAAAPGAEVLAAAAAMAAPMWQAVVGSLLRLVTAVAVYIASLALLRTLLYKKFAAVRKKKIMALTVLFAVITMVTVMAGFVVPVSETFRPYAAGWMSMLQWDHACSSSLIYPVFRALSVLS